jgi:hypothetical protein
MTICRHHLEHVHSQTPMNIGLSIIDVEPIDASFQIQSRYQYVHLFSLIYSIDLVVSLDCLKGSGVF